MEGLLIFFIAVFSHREWNALSCLHVLTDRVQRHNLNKKKKRKEKRE